MVLALVKFNKNTLNLKGYCMVTLQLLVDFTVRFAKSNKVLALLRF
jgi:hypothetical protein